VATRLGTGTLAFNAPTGPLTADPRIASKAPECSACFATVTSDTYRTASTAWNSN
jgi:hypothetical protein